MSLKSKIKFLNVDFTNYYPVFFTLVFILILFQYSLFSFESILYDLRVRYDFGFGKGEEIVLVTLDEESDDYLGDTYPYTYATHYRFLEKLLTSNPKSINYFFKLPEVNVGDKYFENFKNKLLKFESEDGVVNFGTELTEEDGEILPPEKLRSFNYSLAQINIDNNVFAKDDVVRRAIFNVSGFESMHLSIANQYLKSIKKNTININNVQGAYYNDEADANEVLFRYRSSPVEGSVKYRMIPFHRILVGDFPKELFRGKIVLIGPNYISNSENYLLTPFKLDEYKSIKMAIHALIVDAFLNNKTIDVIPKNVSNILALIIGLMLSMLISKLKPKDGLLATIIILILVVLSSYLLFVLAGKWLYTAHLIVTVFVVYYIWIPFRAIGEYQRRFAIQEESKILKQVEKLKQNFVSLMSHDLKTPVAKIAGVADNIYHSNNSTLEVKEKAQVIIDSTKDLNKFISSILDLTKIESNEFGLNKVSKDINLIIESVFIDLNYTAERKKTKLIKDLAVLYPIQIDAVLITRVISNLVENAIKYSDVDSLVKVKTWDDQKWVYVEIEDNGAGIPNDELKNVFEKFYRIKNDANHSIKGSGLGLYLVKYFVELHGGAVSVESELGKGTKFIVKLINQ